MYSFVTTFNYLYISGKKQSWDTTVIKQEPK